MRETFKKVLLATMLFSATLFLGFPSINLANANGNPTTVQAKEKEKVEAAAKEKAKKEEEKKAEQTGDVAEPPSGPNVNREEETKTVDIETPASVTGQKIDGTGTVTDFSTSGSKAFYTITDSEQNVFYLIIDLDKTENNVYFLSDINKSDLSGTAEKTNKIQQPTEKIESAKVEEPKEEKGGNGFLITVLLLAVVGVAAYYFLVMKKKQGKGNEEDEENEEMIEDYEDNFYEDEQENKDNK